MRASRLNLVTLRDDPADAEIASHRLLLRAGFLYKSGSGLYLYAPLMKRVIDKISAIVASEVSGAGGLEVTMPIMQEQGLWEASGRWEGYQATKTMLTVKDRHGQYFGLAPTAEEVVTDFAKNQINSHKQLPVCYFQQHTKFRDEIRPRFGLMRVKEFIMMDAYSFHASEESLVQTYDDMAAAYHRVFERCGLEAYAVEADSGAIGGSGSHEFMVAADVGEDAILANEASGYAANSERASITLEPAPSWEAPAAASTVATPAVSSIADLVSFANANGYADVSAANCLKMVLVVAETPKAEVRVAAAIRGDRDVNEVKLHNAIMRGLDEGDTIAAIRPMTAAEVTAATGCAPGFAGPLPSLQVDQCIIDEQVAENAPLICGANADDRHVFGIILERDDTVAYRREDILLARAGDPDPKGGEPLEERRGIEVGHIFQLGSKYSEPMGAVFNGTDGKLHPLIMGCYGIGTSRVAAAAVEQHHDDAGIKWPLAIAPFHCVVVPAKGRDEQCVATATDIYQQLQAQGVEAVLDDRDLGPGVKFKDWELVGIPLTVVCGRGLADGLVEFKQRADGSKEDVALDAIVDRVASTVQAALK